MPYSRLLIDGPAEGAWNMAVDEVLLQSAQNGIATLRFYQWSPATLSLGYFQPLHERELHQPSTLCPVVRRSSGGGAILHDRELTYSLALPLDERFSAQSQQIYDTAHDGLITVLAGYGIGAERCRASDPRRESRFLCFERRSAGDVLLDGWKIAGSAQRRTGNALLQHGSFLLATSRHAPELPGIQELTGRDMDISELIAKWTFALAQIWDSRGPREALSAAETAAAQQLAETKFSPKGWITKR